MKNRKIIVSGFIVITMLLILGTTYAFFTYSRVSDKNNQLITGEVYMHYNDGLNTINLENAFPLKDEVARSRTDNIIDFTIDGKNTTTNKDIYYEIKLVYGNNIDGKTRLKDKDLKFDLIETINGVSETVLEGMSYDSINNTRIWVNTIPKNTTNEIEINYELRMWISRETTISDTDPLADYTTSVYKNSYANVKLEVYGDFEKKTIYKSLYETLETTLSNNLLDSDGESRILAGNTFDGNYVSYSGYLWQVVSLNDDGTIKLICDETFGSYSESTSYSELKEYLNNDFLNTLVNYEDVLVTDYEWNGNRISASSKNAIIKPTGVLITSPVGLLNLYEYAQSEKNASPNQLSNNKKYQTQFLASSITEIYDFNTYLNNGTSWFLISEGIGSLWYVTDDFVKSCAEYYGGPVGVRPSIVLKNDSVYLKGDGTEGSPYVLIINK